MTRFRFRGHQRANDAINKLKKKTSEHLEKAKENREKEEKKEVKETIEEMISNDPKVHISPRKTPQQKTEYYSKLLKFHKSKDQKAQYRDNLRKNEVKEDGKPRFNLPEKYEGDHSVRSIYEARPGRSLGGTAHDVSYGRGLYGSVADSPVRSRPTRPVSRPTARPDARAVAPSRPVRKPTPQAKGGTSGPPHGPAPSGVPLPTRKPTPQVQGGTSGPPHKPGVARDGGIKPGTEKSAGYDPGVKRPELLARYQPSNQSVRPNRTEVSPNMKAKVPGSAPPPTALQKVQAAVHGAAPPPTGAAISTPAPSTLRSRGPSGTAPSVAPKVVSAGIPSIGTAKKDIGPQSQAPAGGTGRGWVKSTPPGTAQTDRGPQGQAPAGGTGRGWVKSSPPSTTLKSAPPMGRASIAQPPKVQGPITTGIQKLQQTSPGIAQKDTGPGSHLSGASSELKTIIARDASGPTQSSLTPGLKVTPTPPAASAAKTRRTIQGIAGTLLQSYEGDHSVRKLYMEDK